MDEMELLRQQYVDGLPSRLSALERAREGMRAAASAARVEAEAAARRVAHGLRGTGTSYGFPQLTRVAAECEDAPAGPLLIGATERLAAVLRGLQPSTVAATVVVVEDDPDLGRLIERVLGSPGRRVLVATRAAELEPLLRQHDVSLIVLDPAEVARLRELGAIGVLVKPFDPMTLAGELARALGS